MKLLALTFILSIVAVAHANESDPASFISVRVVKTSDDPSGNEVDKILVSNKHDSRAIRATVRWITIARERENDITVKPGQEKTIARNQINARDVQVIAAQFKEK